MITKTSYRGEFEQKILQLIELAKERSPSGFIHRWKPSLSMTGDGKGGGIDALNLLKPYLSSGQLRCILATTIEEMDLLKSDKAFMRRFALLKLTSLSLEDQLKAIKSRAQYLHQFHKSTIDPNELINFINIRFTEKNMDLDSTLDFIDETYAHFIFNPDFKLDTNFLEIQLENYLINRRSI